MTDVLAPIGFGDLEGWLTANHEMSLAAFQRSAAEILAQGSGFRRDATFGGTREDWLPACHAAGTATDARAFFEGYFRPFRVTDPNRAEGLFTGYYEPLVRGSLVQHDDFPVPVYGKPNDLVTFSAEETVATGLNYGQRVNGRPLPFDTREQIENGSLHGRAEAICWLSDWVDAFFMHVQGQGRVALADGSTIRLSYSGKAGHPYTGIGHILIERGVAPKDKMSMQVLREWMRCHPDEARQLMWQNKSYIFFQRTEVTDATLGGIGAAKVNLTPLHSLAVDRANWMFGTPMWIDTTLPSEAPAGSEKIRRLMIAQDTGSAIKGHIRGDFFWGWGDDAELIAGNMKSPGTMAVFLPLPLARRLGGLS